MISNIGKRINMYSYNPDRRGLSEVKLLKLEPWRLYPKGEAIGVELLEQRRYDRCEPLTNLTNDERSAKSICPNRRPSSPAQPPERHSLPRLGLSTPSPHPSSTSGLATQGAEVILLLEWPGSGVGRGTYGKCRPLTLGCPFYG